MSGSHDQKFLEIVQGLQSLAKENANRSVGNILSVSGEFLNKETHSSLKQFYNMYFAEDQDIRSQKEAINCQVDDIIEQIRYAVEESQSTDQIAGGIAETPEQAEKRLGLSGLQKQLETLISLEDDLKKKISPVLHSMQFEDAMRQRIEHIMYGLESIVAQMSIGEINVEQISREVAGKLSSDEERKIYYAMVLREEPPLGVDETSIWLDFGT